MSSNTIVLEIIVKIIFSIIVSGIITFIMCVPLNPLRLVKSLRNSILQTAQATDHIVTGHRVNVIFSADITKNHADDTYGVYEYEVNGKKYHAKNLYHSAPPKEEIFYYRNAPSKAVVINKFGCVEYEWIYVWATLAVLAFAETMFF